MDRLVLWKFFCVFITGDCLVFSSHVSTYTACLMEIQWSGFYRIEFIYNHLSFQ